MISLRNLVNLAGWGLALFCPLHPAAWAEDSPANPPAGPLFSRHVVPLFSKLGCNAGVCHGAVQGKNGFRLSLFGADPATDHARLVHEFAGRRLNLLDPDRSMLLLKSTGRIAHEGGKRLEVDSPEYRMLRAWIAQGAPLDTLEQSRLKQLTVTPAQHTLTPGGQYQLRVEAAFDDGSVEDVTGLCTFESRDGTVVEVDREGRVRAVGVGSAAMLARFRGWPAVGVAFVPAPAAGNFPEVKGHNFIDTHVLERLRRLNIHPSELCDDAIFLRRTSLDVTGALPTPDEVRAFLADNDPGKRARKIEELLGRPGHTALWATKFCDLLKPQFKEDNRAWAEPAYQRRFYEWLRARFEENTPYDELVERIMLATSQEGRSKDELLGELEALAKEDANLTTDLRAYANRRTLDLYWMRSGATGVQGTIQFAHAFLGLRMQCAQCHRHPSDVWQQDDLISFANFFTRLARDVDKPSQADQKKLAEEKKKLGDEVKKLRTMAKDKKLSKEEADKLLAQADALEKQADMQARLQYLRTKFTGLGPTDKANFASVTSPLGKYESKNFRLLGESAPVTVPPGQDARAMVMTWLRKPDNPFFARAIVNRVWAHYFNRGLVDPPDDLSPLNPPTHPELLDELCREFVAHKYDLKWLHRTILNSRSYQLASEPNASNKHDRANYARYYVRRLRAEVLLDAVNQAVGSQETYPDTSYLPVGTKALEVPGISSFNKKGSGQMVASSVDYAFEIFGRSRRDVEAQCDCESASNPALVQSLYLAAYDDLLKKIADPSSRPAKLAAEIGDDGKRIEEAFLLALSRLPTEEEKNAFAAHLKQAASGEKGMEDIFWVLLNTKEFQLNR